MKKKQRVKHPELAKELLVFVLERENRCPGPIAVALCRLAPELQETEQLQELRIDRQSWIS